MNNNQYCTIGIFAHANAGKTTVTENILHETKVIKNVGRVDDGNTVTDSMNIEKTRGITVRSSVVSFEIGYKQFFLIDTPGHVDFSAEVERAVNTLDGAILVVSAVEGVEAQTYTIYEALKRKNVPTVVFINKVDRKNADYYRVIKELKEKLNIKLVTLYDVKCINDNVRILENDLNTLMNGLAEYNDLLIDKYLMGNITKKEVLDQIYELSQKGKISVVVGGTALKGVGIRELLECVEKCLPNFKKTNNSKFSGYVYMVRVEDNITKTYVKVISGEIRIRDEIEIMDGSIQKILSMKLPKGATYVSIDSAKAGQVIVITGITTKPGELIGDQQDKSNYISFVKPKLNIQVNPINLNEVYDLYKALKILEKEDPYLNVRLSSGQNKKIFVTLMGEVQAQIIQTILKERFNILVELKHATLIYKETPTIQGTGEASYTKVSKVELMVYPLPVGSGLHFESRLSTDYLLKKYQRQTERLVYQYSKQGIFGWEVTDALIILTNGRFDSMGSEPKHFNIAVPLALMRALKKCKNKILEPISEYYITIPKNTISDVTKELSYRDAFYEIISQNLENITLHGEIPTKRISDFPVILNELTSGRGLFSSNIKKYTDSKDQNIMNEYIGFDPRNEVKFVINDMGGNLENLDVAVSKKRKSSRSKFKWKSEKKAEL